ncbi:TPA: hypothetical protein HA246_03395 [Candidatus Woesearchaeota archaeon]|nr:hypothetical protein [Candidatus Woesearchaeota archaeon]
MSFFHKGGRLYRKLEEIKTELNAILLSLPEDQNLPPIKTGPRKGIGAKTAVFKAREAVADLMLLDSKIEKFLEETL